MRVILIHTWLEHAVYGIMTVRTLAMTVFELKGWVDRCILAYLVWFRGAYTRHTRMYMCVDLEHGTLAIVHTKLSLNWLGMGAL